MEEDEELADETVMLTREQWEDLMKSIQSLSQANARLVETIAFLLKQNLSRASVAAEVESAQAVADGDPYDLAALRRLMGIGD